MRRSSISARHGRGSDCPPADIVSVFCVGYGATGIDFFNQTCYFLNMEIRFNNDIEKFIASLEKPSIAKVLRTIDLLERFGRQLGPPHSKKVRSDIFELRIRGQQEVRVFYIFQTGGAVLLHGFVKKSRKTPKREVERAIFKKRNLI